MFRVIVNNKTILCTRDKTDALVHYKRTTEYRPGKFRAQLTSETGVILKGCAVDNSHLIPPKNQPTTKESFV